MTIQHSAPPSYWTHHSFLKVKISKVFWQELDIGGLKTCPPCFPDASLGSLETVQVTLCGLGPINFLVRRLVRDLVVQNIRWQPGKISLCTALSRTLNYLLGNFVSATEVDLPWEPGTLPQSDADIICYFNIIFDWWWWNFQGTSRVSGSTGH